MTAPTKGRSARRPKMSPVRGRMLRRYGELVRLGKHRRAHGAEIGDPASWAQCMANVLVLTNILDYLSIMNLAKKIGVDIDDVVAMAAVHEAHAAGAPYLPMTAGLAGQLLGLTTEERLFCEIRTMEATDESAEERAMRVLESRRQRDRDRKRRERVRKAGHLPRPKPATIGELQPWTSLGISRATWYRRKQRDKALPLTSPAHITISDYNNNIRAEPSSLKSAMSEKKKQKNLCFE